MYVYVHIQTNCEKGFMEDTNMQSWVKWKSLCCVWLLRPHGLYSPWNSLDQNTGVGSLSLLQGIFWTQRSNPGLPHCRWILYKLSYQGSSRILEWVACPFSSRSSWLRNWPRVSCIAGKFFTNWDYQGALDLFMYLWIWATGNIRPIYPSPSKQKKVL